jgi:hypothetical protein
VAKKFRFGMQLAEADSRSQWIEQARLAGKLGYDVVVVPDHVGDQLAPLPALVSAAERRTGFAWAPSSSIMTSVTRFYLFRRRRRLTFLRKDD